MEYNEEKIKELKKQFENAGINIYMSDKALVEFDKAVKAEEAEFWFPPAEGFSRYVVGVDPYITDSESSDLGVSVEVIGNRVQKNGTT
tara:strand:- start:2721 stop:2984 length:264 start_codon:yes stop_codon:yes gene_type:complete